MTWYALVTKPQAEQHDVVEQLTVRGYECWMPLAIVERRHANRTAVVEVALFHGYVFLNLAVDQSMESALAAPTIVNVVRSMFGLPMMIPEREILRCKRIVEEAGGRIDLRPRTVTEHIADNRPLRVKLAGPMADPTAYDQVTRRYRLSSLVA